MKNTTIADEVSLTEYLRENLDPHDVESLFPLFKAREILSSFSALFHGGLPAVLIRLVVLREIGNRAEPPEWTPRELEHHFSFLDSSKLKTVLDRLREHNLLVWNPERHAYKLSAAGRVVLSALSNLLASVTEADSELSFLAGQIAAGAAVGNLSSETLAHLLARLAELEHEFEDAVASGSESRLRAAQARLASVEQRMDQATSVLKSLAAAGYPDTASWRIGQAIGDRQSRIMRMASAFQRELTTIARQSVHLGQGGLTSSELAAWLKNRSRDDLAMLAQSMLSSFPRPVFVLWDVMCDNSDELIERDQPGRRRSVLPPPEDAAVATEIARELPAELPAFVRLLAQIDAPLDVADAVVGDNFCAASYRMSLLAFLGEPNIDPDLAQFGRLPLSLRWNESTDALAPVGRAEVAAITPGQLVPQTNGS